MILADLIANRDVDLRCQSLKSPRQRGLGTLFALALATGVYPSNPAAAQFIVAPLRTVIHPDRPKTTFAISNATDRNLSIRIEWIDLSSDGNGGYRPATRDERKALSASPYLTLSPTRVRLEPGGKEEIVVVLNTSVDLPNEERRSHLLFSSTALRNEIQKVGSGLEADIGLAVSTPVIVRPTKKTNDIAVQLSGPSLNRGEDGHLELSVDLERTGFLSAYGSVSTEFVPDLRRTDAPANDFDHRPIEMSNISIPIEVKSTRVAIPLGAMELPAGALTVSYVGESEFEGVVFATETYNIQAPADED
ncbi:MAG: hypothetical protein AAF668_04900 [Pseudomonadota bacterium]